MRRLFYKGRLADTIEIAGSDAHHLMHVMRAKAGDEVVVVDDEGAVARMEMVGFSSAAVTLRLVERLAADTESPAAIVLAPCLLKSDKMELVVQKAVELGTVGVMPLASHNCVARYDAKKAAAKVARWQKIADEAAKQCGRTALLTVEPVTTLTAFLDQFAADSAEADEPAELVFCYENEEQVSIGERLRAARGRRIVLLIGPEGGFTLDEAQAIEAAGGHSVTLGPRILRAETAAIAALVVAQYEIGDLGR